MGAMSAMMRWCLLATLVAVLGGAPRAQAFEAADGAIQGHGFGEMQISGIANDFDGSDDWDLAQWWNVFNLELEWDAAPDGIGPFDYVSFYSRIEVRYDCVWNRGCGMFEKANAFGDRSRHLPKRLVNARRGGFTGAVRTDDRRRFISVSRKDLTFRQRFDEVGDPRKPALLHMVPGFTALFNQGGFDGEVGTEDDPPLSVFDPIYAAGDPVDSRSYRFALRKVPGNVGGVGTQILGPWRPRNKVIPLGTLRNQWNPFKPGEIHPRFSTQGLTPVGEIGPGQTAPAAPLTALVELPFRPAPKTAFDNPNIPISEPQGLWYPNNQLRQMILDGKFDAFDQNFRQAELEWNHGASQQDEKELKELYVDLEFFDGRLWTRIGKQFIVWGKTELLRTTDTFNPQDISIGFLASLEESRIALWAARFVWSFYNVGPLQDVRFEVAANFDQFEPNDLGRCGEAVVVNAVCNKTTGLFAHGVTGVGVAGEVRPPNPWNSWHGLEAGVRLEFRWDRFSVQISDWYGFTDGPIVERLFTYERNVDPYTGRPRKAEFRDRCKTGEETACLKGGDDALFNHHANQTLFSVICASSIFFSSDLDPTACGFTVLGSQFEVVPGITVSNAVGALLKGTNFIASALLQTALPDVVANVPFPGPDDGGALVDLGHVGPRDRSPRPTGAGLESVSFFGGFLTPEQEALFGCGEFYGTTCEGPVNPGIFGVTNVHSLPGGIDLLNAEASAIYQSWPLFEGSGPDGIDPFDASVAQPGTVGYVGGPVCTRFEDGKSFILPGCRGINDPGYDALVDGIPLDSAGEFLLHPYTGQRFKSEVAAVSWNAIVALVLLSGFGDEDKSPINSFDPQNPDDPSKCSLRAPWFCDAVQSFMGISGVQRNVERAGGNLLFGRRDFVWHGGSSVFIRYAKRNVFGVAVDFAEDVTKSNWGIEFTWQEELPFADNDEFDGLREVDTLNLTVSVDRPTFINFLNQNRTFFINSQWFFQWVKGWERSFPTDGPINIIATFTVQTGYGQDRLLPGVTFVYDFQSRSGATLWSLQYRFTENFSVTFGANLFFGRFQRKTQPIVPIGTIGNQQGSNAYRSFVENAIAVANDKDQFFLRIRYTF